jgi:hypothetical protein
MAKKTTTPDGRPFRTTVPQGQLKRIVELEKAYSEQIRKNRIRYPDPDKLDKLTQKALEKHGFKDFDPKLKEKFEQARGGKKKKKGGGKKLPDPAVVDGEIQTALLAANINPVSKKSDVVAIEWNMEFLDDTKVRFFSKTYKRIFECCDIASLVEVSKKGMAELEKVTGLKAYASPENTRGQGVGFLVNTNRFDVIGQTQVWMDVANVQGIPDLRPAFVITVKDKVSGITTNRVVVHLKSMRGGPARTEPVRFQQFQILAKRLGTPVSGCKPLIGDYRLLQIFKNPTIGRGLSDHGIVFVTEKYPSDKKLVDGMWIVCGDFNDFIERNHKVTAPLTAAGFTLVYPKDATSTQASGGRLDGFFRDVSDTTCGAPATGPFADDTSDTATVVQ